jgi:hypothetical protein
MTPQPRKEPDHMARKHSKKHAKKPKGHKKGCRCFACKRARR